MSVERFEPSGGGGQGAAYYEMDKAPDGEWVRFEDYEKLHKELDTLSARFTALIQQNNTLAAENERLSEKLAAMESQEPYGYDSAGDLCYEKDACLISPEPIPLYAKPIPADKPARITEQDAREIADNVMEFNYDHKHSVDYWMREEGCYLLNKLNADREEDVDSEVQRLIHERQCLAEAISGIAAASGDTRTDFTGPDLLQVCGDAAEGIKRLLADREQVPAVAVPDGWKLVPIEPTTQQLYAAESPIDAVISCRQSSQHAIADAAYRAMLAAAPSHSQKSSPKLLTWLPSLLDHYEKQARLNGFTPDPSLAMVRAALANVYDTVRDCCPSHESDQP